MGIGGDLSNCIGIDLDGVLRDLHAPICKWWFLKTGIKKTPEDIHDWDWYTYLEGERGGLSREEFYRWYRNESVVYQEAVPIFESTKYVSILARKYDLILATVQLSPCARKCSLEWVEHFFPNCFKAIFMGEDKGLLELDILIDDYWQNLDLSCTWTGILFDQPWNRHIMGYRRIKSWREIEVLCEHLLGSV